jgi:capsular polysaccharide biosynthesis protein
LKPICKTQLVRVGYLDSLFIRASGLAEKISIKSQIAANIIKVNCRSQAKTQAASRASNAQELTTPTERRKSGKLHR